MPELSTGSSKRQVYYLAVRFYIIIELSEYSISRKIDSELMRITLVST